MSIDSSSLINATSTLDDTMPPTVTATQDGTTEPRPPSEHAHARDGIVAPPALLTRHARISRKPLLDLHNSMAIDQHYSMDTGSSVRDRPVVCHPARLAVS